MMIELLICSQVILIPILGLILLGLNRERRLRENLLKEIFNDKFRPGFGQRGLV